MAVRSSGRGSRRSVSAVFALPLALSLAAVAVAPTIASALPIPGLALLKHQRQVSYPMNQVWPTAIRYLRVERGYAIEDKDETSGYILFTFPHGDKMVSGSLEFLADEDAIGRPAVTMISSTQRGPSHLPYTLLDGIATKLREERGQPRMPPSREPAPDDPAPDDPAAPGTSPTG